MGYEIYLRREGSSAPDEEALKKRLADSSARIEEGRGEGRGEGRWVVDLRKSVGAQVVTEKARFALRELRDDKGLSGYDLDVPFGSPEAEMKSAISLAFGLSEAGPLVLFDPQMGKTILRNDEEDVVETWKQVAAWQVDMAGVREDARAVAPTVAIKPLVDRKTQLLLFVLGGILLLAWGIGAALSAFLETP